MSITLAVGVSAEIAKTYAAAVPFTGANISNAPNAVVTVTHALAAGDYVEITSGWGRLNGRILRVLSVSTTVSFVLEGLDTSNLNLYPAGAGGGSFRKISAWTAMSQIKAISGAGGDMQYTPVTAIDDVVEKQMPSLRSVQTLSLEVFDDMSLPWYADVLAASNATTNYAVRLTMPSGTKVLGNGNWSMQNTPNIAQKEALTVKIDVSYVSQPTRYAS